MEYTLRLAIARSKREFLKYGSCNYPSITHLWNVFKEIYHLRDDEKKDYYRSISKWVFKNYLDLRLD